jgi:hypothetical protein
MGYLHPMWEDSLSTDEEIKNKALENIAKAGYNYSLPGMIMASIDENRSFSLVRLGDGELSVLTQLYKSIDEVHRQYPFLRSTGYCGVDAPSMPFVHRMVDAIKNASVVGMFENDPFNKEVFQNMNYYPKNKAHAFENLYLPMRKDFVDIMRKYPPLIIGRRSKEYAAYFKEMLNIDCPECIGIESYHEMDKVIDKAMEMKDEWKWVFVSAGCTAVVIAAELDYKHGKVAIDSGHMIDNILAKWDGYWLCTK